MIKETYTSETIRVRITKDENGKFWIRTEQDANDIPGMPWEKGADGWRGCFATRTNTLEEAEAEYRYQIDFQRRMHG